MGYLTPRARYRQAPIIVTSLEAVTMDQLVIRILKTALLALLMYVSVGLLGFSATVALLLATIPVVLMVLGIYTGFAFRLVVVVFLVACVKVVLQDKGVDQGQITGALNGLIGGMKARLASPVH